MSLRARVTLGFTAVLAVALATAGTFLYVRFADRKLDPLAAQLRDDIETGRRTEGEVK